MTETAPRGPMGPGPATMPAVSWYEFVLDERRLENHLKEENPGLVEFHFILLVNARKTMLLPITGQRYCLHHQTVRIWHR